jgi:ABC-2 type transport system permease protein
MFDSLVRLDLMAKAAAFNAIYLGMGVAAFLYSFRVARERGTLLHVGE